MSDVWSPYLNAPGAEQREREWWQKRVSEVTERWTERVRQVSEIEKVRAEIAALDEWHSKLTDLRENLVGLMKLLNEHRCEQHCRESHRSEVDLEFAVRDSETQFAAQMREVVADAWVRANPKSPSDAWKASRSEPWRTLEEVLR